MGQFRYQQLNGKSNSKSRVRRVRALYKTIRALSLFSYLARVRDYSVRRLNKCAEMASYAGIVAAPGVAISVPMSRILNSTSFSDYDNNYRELIGAAIRREKATRTRTGAKLSDHQPFPRSFSSGMGHYHLDQLGVERIDEESSSYFSADEDLRFPRRSYGAVQNMNLHGRRNPYAV